MRGGGAGAHHAEIRAARTQLNRHQSAAHVADERRNRERGHLARPAFQENLELLLVGVHAPDPRTNDDPYAVAILRGRIQVGISHRQLGGGKTEVRVPVVAPDLFRIHVPGRIKPNDFGPDLAGIVGHIKLRDPGDSIPAGQDVRPECFDIKAEGGDDTQAGDDNTGERRDRIHGYKKAFYREVPKGNAVERGKAKDRVISKKIFLRYRRLRHRPSGAFQRRIPGSPL